MQQRKIFTLFFIFISIVAFSCINIEDTYAAGDYPKENCGYCSWQSKKPVRCIHSGPRSCWQYYTKKDANDVAHNTNVAAAWFGVVGAITGFVPGGQGAAIGFIGVAGATATNASDISAQIGSKGIILKKSSGGFEYAPWN